MFENLSERLQEVIKKTKGQAQLTEDNMQDALREVRRALLEADVNLKVVKGFISKIKDRAEGEQVLKSIKPSEQLIKIVHDEIVELLGHELKPLELNEKFNIVMLLGLQGSGKTTSAAKLALRLRKENKKPLLVAADVYRPAAIDQLIALAKQINIDIYFDKNSKDVKNIVKDGINHAKENSFDTVIIDTAGRLQIDNELMAELVIIDRLFNPAEKLLAIDSMIGQEAVNTAMAFDEQLGITGVILTKLDGDTRGGSALSIAQATGKPIKFAGTGEKMDALEPFHPDRIAQRILGMGDILTLVEKAQEAVDIEQAKELQQKFNKNEFNFEDFLNVQKQMKMLGPLDKVLGMLPIPNISKDQKELIAHGSEKELKKSRTIINSMTIKERQNPNLLNHSRRLRISKGCGLQLSEVNAFVKNFEKMQKMMKQFNKMSKTMRGKKHSRGGLPTDFGRGFFG